MCNGNTIQTHSLHVYNWEGVKHKLPKSDQKHGARMSNNAKHNMALLLLSGSPIVIPLIKESAQAQKNKAASTAMQDVQGLQE